MPLALPSAPFNGGTIGNSLTLSSGILTIPNGSAASPTLKFAGGVEGLFRSGAGVGIVAAGAERFWVTAAWNRSTVPIQVADGAVGAPAFAFTSDNTTGIYLAGSTLAFVNAGVFKLGISATSIRAIIPFDGAAGTTSAASYGFDTDSDTGMYRVGANNIGFTAGNGLRLDITTALVRVASGIDLQLGRAASAAAGVASTHKIEVKDSSGTSYYALATNVA